MLDERAQARLARPPEDLLGERGAFERQRDMGGERLKRARLAARRRAIGMARHERAARDAVPFERMDQHAVGRIKAQGGDEIGIGEPALARAVPRGDPLQGARARQRPWRLRRRAFRGNHLGARPEHADAYLSLVAGQRSGGLDTP